MSESPQMPDLKLTKADYVSSAAKSALGAVPFVGSLLSEIAGTVIPNQRIERIVKYAELLEEKIKHVDQSLIRARLLDENTTDLLEESLRQAARAVSDERKEQLAHLMSRGLTETEVASIELKHLLRMLGELNDVEIVWLRFHSHQTMQGDDEFRERHKDVLGPIPVHFGAPPSQLDKAALQKSYQEHLVRLGLLRHRYRMDPRTKTPEFDSGSGGGLKIGGYELTAMGRLLLRYIGLASSNED